LDPDGKNSDPGSGINIPDPQHCFFCVYKINGQHCEIFVLEDLNFTECTIALILYYLKLLLLKVLCILLIHENALHLFLV
jgi:hypothetical protein